MSHGRVWLALVALCVACGESEGGEASAEPPWELSREAGWLRGDLHLHTTWSHDGWDSVGQVIALAEYLESDLFLDAHPEYVGNGVDFLGITDHRNIDVANDPELASDRLVVVAGEETGSDGHANVWGHSSHISHDPMGTGATHETVQSAAKEAHAQGALFSPNHLYLEGDPWYWDVREIDSIEIWSSGWAVASAPYLDKTKLEAWEADHGPASPFFRHGLTRGDGLASDQSLAYYEALLARGIHTAVVGGSDRHTLVLPGFPTTYVQATSADRPGLLEGIRRRHTFVSRTPASAQLAGNLTVNGKEYQFGDAVPLGADQLRVQLEIQVTRASGGILRVLRGSSVASDAELGSAPMGKVVLEAETSQEPTSHTYGFEARPGDWLYAMVWEPLIFDTASPAMEAKAREAAAAAIRSGANPTDLIPVVGDLVDNNVLLDGSRCDPEAWDPELFQCVPLVEKGFGTFFIPDYLDRAMNVVAHAGQPTEYCMGAIASALVFSR